MQDINYLLPITTQTIDSDSVNTVNARELHTFLEVGRDFSTWFKARITKYNFIENKDYITLTQMGELENKGLQHRIDYFITLDMAKELCMVERNLKGKEARQYFIHCEKQANKPLSIQTHIKAVEAYLHELKQHEQTRANLTHEKEMVKLENGKSVYGASISQVRAKTLTNYSWFKLQNYCLHHGLATETIHPNGYDSLGITVYPAEAWLNVYNINLDNLFKD